ncbi:MAG TPA: small multi-drug export protein [Symbiobacteriaceae bacterium]
MVDRLIAILATLGVSAVPGLEMRLGIPLGMVLGLPMAVATVAGVTGNLLQIPLALWTVAAAHRFVNRVPAVHRWLSRLEARVGRYEPLVRRWGWLGMALFVCLPLPATGVWGGVVVARLIRMQAWAMWVGLSLGLAITGVICGLTTYGAFAAWRYFFP